MSAVEFLISLAILVCFSLTLIVSISKVAEIDLSKDYIETATYAGLWKTDLHKIYNGSSCTVISPDLVNFKRISDVSLSKLEVRSFRWAKSGTYGNGTTIEPILFKVGGK
ncbi:MAG TPA: hypothetical protein PLQ59_05340 [Fervidobacterium sp.]|nr:hypothetical protein [Fervidobacterium sp.]HOH53336.1 hypothetical protein [Fervidobacterium sp.]HOK34322.1 hypothetical protein [Fervidobacterium sp.]HOL04384.1 hypothetical protein [Fervidobacterium sp.]HOV53189.1 hypothetical protein [Fervidobacterium sp.]